MKRTTRFRRAAPLLLPLLLGLALILGSLGPSTPPPASAGHTITTPAGLQAHARDGGVTLTFTRGGPPSPQAYEIEYGRHPVGSTAKVTTTATSNSPVSHTVPNLTNGDTHRFRVRGAGGSGHTESAWTDWVTATPMALPANSIRIVSIAPGDRSLDVVWERSPGVNLYNLRWRLKDMYRDVGGEQPGLKGWTPYYPDPVGGGRNLSSATVPTRFDTGRAIPFNGHLYEVQVQGVYGVGNTRTAWVSMGATPVGAVDDAVALSALSGAASTDGSDFSGTLTLTPVFDGDTTTYFAQVAGSVTHLKLTPTVATNGATVAVGRRGGSLAAVTSGSASAALALAGRAGYDIYDVRVTSGGSNQTYTVEVRRLVAPSNVTAVASALDGAPVITVGATGAGRSSYLTQWQFKLASEQWGPLKAALDASPAGLAGSQLIPVGSSSFGGLLPNTEYDVRAHYSDETGSILNVGFPIGIASNSVRVTTWGEPGKPTSVTAAPMTTIEGDELTVVWTAPTDVGGSGRSITGYKVRWRVKDANANVAGDQPGAWNAAGGVDASGTSHLASSLTAETAYEVQVRASNGVHGPWSDSAVGTTTQFAGALDDSFSGDGKLTTNFGNNDEVRAVAIQSDGKIVTAGFANDGSDDNFALARYNADGALDTSFSSDGKLTTDFSGNDDQIRAVAIQSDGKIVAAGFANDGSDDNFALARYNTDGSLDTSFSSDGKLTTDFSGNDDQIRAVAIQSDGKIVAAGFADDGTDHDFALARYNPDGSLDTSFSSDGKLTTDFSGKDDEAYALVIQPDGKIVLAGYATNDNRTADDTDDDHKDFALARYNPDGSLDAPFMSETRDFGSNDGKVANTLFNTNDQEGYALALQSDGKFVVAGRSWSGIDNDFALARHSRNGPRDLSFGTSVGVVRTGNLTTDFSGTGNRAYAVAVQSDGKIVVAGHSWNDGNHNFALARYTIHGDLDTTFGYGGWVVTDIKGDDYAYAMAIQCDGKIVVGGRAGGNFALTRYIGDGIASPAAGCPAQQNSPANRAPTVAQPIADVDGLPVGESRQISLAGVFSYDGYGALTIFAASSSDDVVRVAADLDGSSLTLSGESAGTATIRVIAEDPQGERVFDEFEVTVAGSDQQQQQLNNALIAQMVEWRNDPQWVSQKAHTDRWDRALLAFGETVSDGSLTAMPATEAQTYADRGWQRWAPVAAALTKLESASQQQQQPQPQQQQPQKTNNAPTVASAIADATIVNERGTHRVALPGVFNDADEDTLTIKASSSAQSVATAAVSNETLTVTAKSRGSATITVTAGDGNGGTVSDQFTVTVKAAPVVASPVADVRALDAEDVLEITLSDVFSDADGDELTYSAASTNEDVAAAYVFQGVTVLGIRPGTVTVTLTAQDTDGNRVSDSFTVTVRSKVNAAPTVGRSMADVSGLTEQTTKRVLLSGAFRDADNDRLTITATSSNNAVARVSVDRNQHGLTVNAVSAGTATITVTARDDRGGSASITFAVTVVAAATQSEPQTETQSPASGEEQDVVARYDTDGDGKISLAEYNAAIPDLGTTLTVSDLIKLRAAYVASSR